MGVEKTFFDHPEPPVGTQPALTRAETRAVDRIAVEELAIPSLVLMENAGRNAAAEIARLAARAGAARVCVFCGTGGNGGDGFVVIRHLANRGLAIRAFLVGQPERLASDCAANCRIVEAMGIGVSKITLERQAAELAGTLGAGDLVVDALLGSGFSGRVRSPVDRVIQAINDADAALVVAIDVPSGLDCDTGAAGHVAVRADRTLTFVASKVGFSARQAKPYVGRVKVLDIGAPPQLVNRILLERSAG